MRDVLTELKLINQKLEAQSRAIDAVSKRLSNVENHQNVNVTLQGCSNDRFEHDDLPSSASESRQNSMPLSEVHVEIEPTIGRFPHLSYFKGRNIRRQKLSRVSKIAKFRELKFREFHFMKKIHGKTFAVSRKSSFFGGNKFYEWLRESK